MYVYIYICIRVCVVHMVLYSGVLLCFLREEHLRNVFGKKMGFTDQDIVALSGAHTIGRVFKERSGACPFGYGEQAASKYTKAG